MSALVVGCFAPDFAHLVWLKPHSTYGHTLSGIFFLDLPASLAMLWLFHVYAKPPLLIFLPGAVRQRLKDPAAAFSLWPPARLMLILLSILIGIATHIAWDSFTHKDTWPYEHWQLLRLNVQLPTGSMAVYKLLEYGSSLFGIAVLAIWFWHWYRTTEPSRSPVADLWNAAQRRIVIVVLPAVAFVGGILRAFRAVGIPRAIRPVVYFCAYSSITAIAIFLLGLLVCGLVMRRQMTGRGEES